MIYGSESGVLEKVSCSFNALILLFVWSSSISVAAGTEADIADTLFEQEYHEAFPLGEGEASNDVRAVAIDRTDSVWAGTQAGAYRLDRRTKQWIEIMRQEDSGPVYDIVVDRDGIVWIGAWNGLYRSSPDGLKKLEQIDCPIATLCTVGDLIIG
jgi:ligand-binding sensor domain-containing protein